MVPFVNKQKELLQIYVHDFHNYLILSITQGGLFSSYDKVGNFFIGGSSLHKYMTKHINLMSSKNIITCSCEIFISLMLLRYKLNKLQLIL